MFSSLRTRIILSHVLPIILLLPLLSFVLLYLIETRYFMVNAANEMAVQAALIGEILRADTGVWNSEESAEQIVDYLHQQLPSQLPARIMLLDSRGTVMASSLPVDAEQVGQEVQQEVERRALSGETAWDLQYSFGLGERVIDVAVPVLDDQGELLGVVSVSQSINQMAERLRPLRWVVLVTFAIGLLISSALAIVLANSLGASLLRLTHAVYHFSVGSPPEILPESGSREMRVLTAHYNEMAQRLYDYEVDRRRLLAGVIHEVSRPLGGINTAAQLLSRRTHMDPELVQELGGEIELSVEDIRQQIDDLSLLAQSQRGNLELHLEPLDVHELIDERCAHTINRIRKGGLQLTIDVSDDLPPILADPVRIAQVLNNLLDNARKYSPKGGRIAVSAALKSDSSALQTVVIRVTDEGPGIAETEQEKIFQYFYRSPANTQASSGMGIGLALAQELIKAHGGRLEVISAAGHGATFVLYLRAVPTAS